MPRLVACLPGPVVHSASGQCFSLMVSFIWPLLPVLGCVCSLTLFRVVFIHVMLRNQRWEWRALWGTRHARVGPAGEGSLFGECSSPRHTCGREGTSSTFQGRPGPNLAAARKLGSKRPVMEAALRPEAEAAHLTRRTWRRSTHLGTCPKTAGLTAGMAAGLTAGVAAGWSQVQSQAWPQRGPGKATPSLAVCCPEAVNCKPSICVGVNVNTAGV